MSGGNQRKLAIFSEIGQFVVYIRPDALARRIATAVNEGELDGIIVIVPDFISDLKTAANGIFPMLANIDIQSNIVKRDSHR